MQSKFSWKETEEVGLTELVTFSPYSPATVGVAVLRAGENAVAEQLINLAINGGKFDIRAVLAAMTTAGLDTELDININDPLAKNFETRAVNTVFGDIATAEVEGKMNVKMLAAEVLGTELVDGVQTALTQKSKDQDYAQASQASQGQSTADTPSATAQSTNNNTNSSNATSTNSASRQQQARKQKAQQWNQATQQNQNKDWNPFALIVVKLI